MRILISEIVSEFRSYLRNNVFHSDPTQDKRSRNVFFIMNSVYLGFLISLFYGVITSGLVYIIDESYFNQYLNDFFINFNYFITGGLVLGLTYQIYRTQKFIPNLITNVLGDSEINLFKEYIRHKSTYLSTKSSLRIITIHIILSFSIFYFAKFPYENKYIEIFMLVFGCSLFGCGVYVGRKLFYIAQMLQAIEEIKLKNDLFTTGKLDGISTYVNVVTTFTILGIWFHINSFYNGPFEYVSIFGKTVKILMFYPAIIAMPVLIVFNYYPRIFLRKLYSQSIDLKIKKLNKELKSKPQIDEFERIKYVSEIDKISRDELKYQLRLAINDLPLIITIVIMLVDVMV